MFGHDVSGSLQGSGIDVTIQFPHILEAGSGIAIHKSYGPKHIAIPISAVSVGITYNLNFELFVHHGTHRNQSFIHFNGNPNIQGNCK